MTIEHIRVLAQCRIDYHSKPKADRIALKLGVGQEDVKRLIEELALRDYI